LAALAAQLSPSDRLRLVERIARDLAGPSSDPLPRPRVDWMSLRGIAPNLLEAQDAQDWVTAARREADERRDESLGRRS
jgi:hypothetical protein